jgi:hypothetical protein
MCVQAPIATTTAIVELEDSDTEDDDEIVITAEVPVIVPETPSSDPPTTV